jgi:hypothetical protein
MKHPGLCFTARRLTRQIADAAHSLRYLKNVSNPTSTQIRVVNREKSQNISDARRSVMIAMNLELIHRIGIGLKEHGYEGVGRKTAAGD